MLTTKQIVERYGEPGDASKLTDILLPFPMEIAWKPGEFVRKIKCHSLVASQLQVIFTEILTAYGLEEIKRLGMDQLGGCVNVRPMRGKEKKYEAALQKKDKPAIYECLSRHAWGIAIDLDPARNALKTKAPFAQFSKPEYKKMIDIFYQYEFISYGREKNYDWMHFEVNV